MNDTTKPAAALECPFCGSTRISDGEVLTGRPSGATATQSMCEECGALGPEAILPPDEVDYGDVRAITAWNRRDKLHALLRDFQAIAHDNEYSLGDRLQRISLRISGILAGATLDDYEPHLPRIAEQPFDIEAARAAFESGDRSHLQPSIDTDEFWNLVIAYCKGVGSEGKVLVEFIDAKISQARIEAVRSADNFRQLVSDSDSAEIKEWKIRCFAAEEKLASIRAAVEGLQRYTDACDEIPQVWNNGAYFLRDNVLKLFE